MVDIELGYRTVVHVMKPMILKRDIQQPIQHQLETRPMTYQNDGFTPVLCKYFDKEFINPSLVTLQGRICRKLDPGLNLKGWDERIKISTDLFPSQTLPITE